MQQHDVNDGKVREQESLPSVVNARSDTGDDNTSSYISDVTQSVDSILRVVDQRLHPQNEPAPNPVRPFYKDQLGSNISIQNTTINNRNHDGGRNNNIGDPSTSEYAENAIVVGSASIHQTSDDDQTSIPIADAYIIPDQSANVAQHVHVVQLDERATTGQHVPNPNSTTGETTSRERSSREIATRETATRETSGDTSNQGSKATANETCGGSDDGGSRHSAADYDKFKEIAMSVVRNERRFWIHIVIAAIVLNSLLVAGVVVAVFCGKGACRRPEPYEPDANFSFGELASPVPAPTSPPSRYLQTVRPNTSEAVHSTYPPSSEASEDVIDKYHTSAPNANISFGGDAIPEKHGSFDRGGPPPIGPIIVVAVVAELLIMCSLALYYRYWKRRQKDLLLEEYRRESSDENGNCSESLL